MFIDRKARRGIAAVAAVCTMSGLVATCTIAPAVADNSTTAAKANVDKAIGTVNNLKKFFSDLHERQDSTAAAAAAAAASGGASTSASSTASAASGKTILAANCRCHGPDGISGRAPKLNASSGKSEDVLAKVISDGRGRMPAYKSRLSGDQIADVVAYIKQLK